MAPPGQVWVHNTESEGYISVHWSPVDGASSYRVRVYTSADATSPYKSCITNGTSCRINVGTTHYTLYAEVGAVSASTGNITWSPRIRTYRGGPSANYDARGDTGSVRVHYYPHFYTSSGDNATSAKKVRYRRVGTQQWTEVNVPTTSLVYTLSGLGPNECYEFQVLIESTPQDYETTVSTGWQPGTPVSACSR